MPPCATCESLMDSIRIDTPGRLLEVASSLLPYLHQGKLEQVAGDTSLDEIAHGKWGDLVAMSFRCTTCGNGYELAAETYHGSGGAWRRADSRGPEDVGARRQGVMMLYQLDSVLGGDRSLPVEVAATKQEWSVLAEWFADMGALRLRGEKRVLEQVLPDEFVRAVLAKSGLSCFATSDGKYLRSRSYAGTDRRISALDVYARFGGTVLEEVYERGMTETGERQG